MVPVALPLALPWHVRRLGPALRSTDLSVPHRDWQMVSTTRLDFRWNAPNPRGQHDGTA